ncbi:hypothetical protein QE152_g30930 [Popillia japonica]|uniref:Reverse transcriptase domain-containing protein n=1 Tax=Popillia japonica TaxID=7064 RepID=A0AAW1JC52_POPJA
MKDSVHIIKKLDDYFIPKTNKSIERHRFNNRVQMPGEDFDSFIGDLRKLAKNCDFGGMKEELLTDRIVCSAEITESHLKEFTHKNQAEIGAINKTSPRNTADKDRYTRQGQKNHRQCGGARQQVPAGVQEDKSSRPWEKSRNNGNNSGSSERDQAMTIKSNVSNNRFKCNRSPTNNQPQFKVEELFYQEDPYQDEAAALDYNYYYPEEYTYEIPQTEENTNDPSLEHEEAENFRITASETTAEK